MTFSLPCLECQDSWEHSTAQVDKHLVVPKSIQSSRLLNWVLPSLKNDKGMELSKLESRGHMMWQLVT